VKRAEYAQTQARALEPRLPKLAITAPAKPPTGFSVQRDGAPVNTAELGLALYVDPGEHEVSASAPGFVSFSQKITAVEAKTETLAIPDLAAEPTMTEEKVATETEEVIPDEVVPPSPTRKYLGLGLGGAGVVAVGVGLAFGAKAMSANNKAKDLCGDELACSSANFDEGQRLIDDGRSKATVSTVLVIAGGAAIAAGAVVFLTAPRASDQRTARLVPLLDRGGAGVGLAGSF
jgi:hypothetical protein